MNNQKLFIKNGDNPVVTNSSSNNGITGYTNLKTTEDGNIVTYSDTTTADSIFYQPSKFVGYSHIQGLYPIKYVEHWNRSTLLFVASSFRKSAGNTFSYGNKFNRKIAKTLIIKLPTRNNEIDFDFMERIVAELEAQRVAELEAYLETTRLNDYELTDEEKKVLSLSEKTASNKVRYSADDTKNKMIKFKSFKLGELFKSQTGDVDLQQKDINNKGVYFINSGNTNYGIKGKTDRRAKTFSRNTITIDFFGNAYYRNYEYKLATHNHVFSLSGNVIKNDLVGQYLISTMQYLTKIYGYSLMATWTKLKENEIKLPVTENGKINFDYMEKYITAIEKLTIKNVVEYKDKLIEQTKKLVD